MTGLSQASYRIELESGKSVITRYYWEEDGWVMFYQYDGVVGYQASEDTAVLNNFFR